MTPVLSVWLLAAATAASADDFSARAPRTLTGAEMCLDIARSARTFGTSPRPCVPGRITGEQLIAIVTEMSQEWEARRARAEQRREINDIRAQIEKEREERLRAADEAARQRQFDQLNRDIEMGRLRYELWLQQQWPRQ